MKKHHIKWIAAVVAVLGLALLVTIRFMGPEGVKTVEFDSREQAFWFIEVLSDDLLLISWQAHSGHRGKGLRSLPPSPMAAPNSYAGPTHFHRQWGAFTTARLHVENIKGSDCLRVSDPLTHVVIQEICSVATEEPRMEFTLTSMHVENLYGLGAEFGEVGNPNGDWIGRERQPGNEYGNAMNRFHGGETGNVQIPVLYGLAAENASFGLWLDNVFAQSWDFRESPWKLSINDRSRVDMYFWRGRDLRDLRARYMRLTGFAPVPPKRAFGLWVSEYGFDDWRELDQKLAGLRGKSFPLDGMVLDLQWFGGIKEDSEESHMGTLTWDLTKFLAPREKIKSLREDQGIELIHIEESYISLKAPNNTDAPELAVPFGGTVFEHLSQRGFLVQEEQGESLRPQMLVNSPWWGRGGMIDWVQAPAGDFWHDWKRRPLIQDGFVGHWTDLGEPETFNVSAWYGRGKRPHRQVHNLYNFYWAESVARGYQRHEEKQRPFILSRSGTSGIQRFGTALWSGDIGVNLASLRSHQNAQMHMALSGIDYYSTDTGGFHWRILDEDVKDTYTRWFAASSLVDFPFRVHTENLCNCRVITPDKAGDPASNLANLRRRYALIPYLYSVAHLAHQRGEMLVPPLAYHFPQDLTVRKLSSQKMLGPSLMTALGLEAEQRQMRVYLPEGKWYDFENHQVFESKGEWLEGVSLYQGKRLAMPLYARAGAILPMAKITPEVLNSFGERKGAEPLLDLEIRVYPSPEGSEFIHTEDDGRTIGYQNGEVSRWRITQKESAGGLRIEIKNLKFGHKIERPLRVKVVSTDKFKEVTLNGKALSLDRSQGLVEVKLDPLNEQLQVLELTKE